MGITVVDIALVGKTGTVRFSHECVICPSDMMKGFEAILGMDILFNQGAVIELRKEIMTINNVAIDLHQRKGQENFEIFNISASETDQDGAPDFQTELDSDSYESVQGTPLRPGINSNGSQFSLDEIDQGIKDFEFDMCFPAPVEICSPTPGSGAIENDINTSLPALFNNDEFNIWFPLKHSDSVELKWPTPVTRENTDNLKSETLVEESEVMCVEDNEEMLHTILKDTRNDLIQEIEETKELDNKGKEIMYSIMVYNNTDDDLNLPLPPSYAELEETEPEIKPLEEYFHLEHLSSEEKALVIELVKQFPSIFQCNGVKVGKVKDVIYEVVLKPGVEPIRAAPFKIPKNLEPLFHKELSSMMKSGILEEADDDPTAFFSPIFCVVKKTTGEPKIRPLIDLRGLNNVVQTMFFPIPDLNVIIRQIGPKCKYLTVIDVSHAFFSIEVAQTSRKYFSFSCSFGNLRFARLPQGYKNSPFKWAQTIAKILSGIPDLICFYDDCLAYGGNNLAEHLEQLATIFSRFKEANVTVNPEKLKFLQTEVPFLGYDISLNGIKPSKSKVECIKKIAVPKKVKDIRSMVGVVGYFKMFIPRYSEVIEPLTRLTKKSVKFHWGPEQETAWNTLVDALASEPIMIHPDFNSTFVLAVDASDVCLGGTIGQFRENVFHPISYMSRRLSDSQTRFNTTEKELLALVTCVKEWNYYLYLKHFIIFSDHRPLAAILRTTEHASPRVHRYSLYLANFSFDLIYIEGKNNKLSDWLSRLPVVDINEESASIDGGLKNEADKDSINVHMQSIGAVIGEDHNLFPIISKDKIMAEQAADKELESLISNLKNSPSFSDEFALDGSGVLYKLRDHKHREDRVYAPVAYAIPDLQASTLARCLLDFVCAYGCPKRLICDNFTSHRSKLFKDLNQVMGIPLVFCASYSPISNGAVEKFMRYLGDSISHYIDQHNAEHWEDFLQPALMAYRSSVCKSIHETPFFCLFGRDFPTPNNNFLRSDLEPMPARKDYKVHLRNTLKTAYREIIKHTTAEKEKAIEYYNRRSAPVSLTVGDLVMIRNKANPKQTCSKFLKRFSGPARIEKRATEVSFFVKPLFGKQNKLQLVHYNRLKPCHMDVSLLEGEYADESDDDIELSVPAEQRVAQTEEVVEDEIVSLPYTTEAESNGVPLTATENSEDLEAADNAVDSPAEQHDLENESPAAENNDIGDAPIEQPIPDNENIDSP
ncbi:hypothetical protein FOCC_FOCC012735, partial [Frankliniella occidentalis]